MKPVVLLSVVEQLQLLQKRTISPLELAEEHIQQIERLNPALNALVDFDAERVRKQARAIEGSPGSLAGLPMTIKSSIAVSGYRCEIGSLIHQGRVLDEDAVVVARLRAAGATILGTTNCPEFLMAYETDNRLHGRTSNPWSLELTPGGSSGGESAAIAAGLSAGGLGSDSGGSVREPAHFTGICSLKPTPGRISGRGHQPPCVGPFAILGAIGPMARTIADVSLLFGVLSGRDEEDPAGAPVGVSNVDAEDLKRIPIGYLEDDGLIPVTEETRMAVRSAARALEVQGFKVRPYRPRSLELARKLWWTFFVRCGAMFYEPIIRGKEDLLSPIFQEFLSFAAADGPLSADELLFAWAECDLIRSKLLAELSEVPILITPVCAVPAFRHGERAWQIEGTEVGYLDAMRFTQWFNLLGAPAAVVPVGRSPQGLPIGVQVAGRPYADEQVLGIAAAIESEFGYVAPPLS
jgi:amidase